MLLNCGIFSDEYSLMPVYARTAGYLCNASFYWAFGSLPRKRQI